MTNTTILPSSDAVQPIAAPPSRFATLGYVGPYLERGPGIVFAATRVFVAAEGRWLQEDAIGFAASDANLCHYVDERS